MAGWLETAVLRACFSIAASVVKCIFESLNSLVSSVKANSIGQK